MLKVSLASPHLIAELPSCGVFGDQVQQVSPAVQLNVALLLCLLVFSLALTPLIAKGAELGGIEERYRLYINSFPENRRMEVTNRLKECISEARGTFIISGDTTALGPNISVGLSVTSQLIRYNLSSGKAAVNTPGLGAGIAFRWYPQDWFPPEDKDTQVINITNIHPDCRATTFDARTLRDDPAKGKVVFPALTLSPTLFIAKAEERDSLSIQPALVAGFLRDILNIGVGFNLTKPGAGDVFLLFGIGAGFRF